MDDNILADNLHKLMSNTRLTASELGRHLNLPAATIKKIRTGENKNPTITTLIPIAKYFNITISELIGDIVPAQQLSSQNNVIINSHLNNNVNTLSTNTLTNGNISNGNITHATNINLVPLITFSEVINWNQDLLLKHKSENRQQILIDKKLHELSFAVLINSNYNIFKKNATIVVEPLTNNNSQDHEYYAIVYKNGQTNPSIKKIIAEDDVIYMQSLIANMDNTLQKLDDSYTIIGKIIAYKYYFI